MPANPLVSVIVPTKNSERTLEACLTSIKAQSYTNIELIVVDNFSTDKTQEIAKKYAKSYQKGPERSTQRNFGAKKSKGSFLLFIDSDMVLEPGIVKESVSVLSADPSAKAAIVPELSFGEGFWAECKALEKACYVGDETIEAARFFERKIYFDLGGYDEAIAGGGEDWDLPNRVKKNGFKISRVSSFIKHDEGSLSLSNSMKKKYYYAKTIGIYMKKHPEIAKKQAKLIRPAFIHNWRLLAKDPIHATGMLFMKTGEFVAVFFAMVRGK